MPFIHGKGYTPDRSGKQYASPLSDLSSTVVGPGNEAGTLLFIADSPLAGYRWLIERISTWSDCNIPLDATVSSEAFLTVYVDQIANDSIVDFTRRGSFDMADEIQPIVIESFNRLILKWSNLGGIDLGGGGTTLNCHAQTCIQYSQEHV